MFITDRGGERVAFWACISAGVLQGQMATLNYVDERRNARYVSGLRCRQRCPGKFVRACDRKVLGYQSEDRFSGPLRQAPRELYARPE